MATTKTTTKTKTPQPVKAVERKKGIGLRNIVFVSMFAASAIPVAVSSYLSYEKTKAEIYAQADDELKFSTRSNTDLLQSWIDGNLALIKGMSLSQDAVDMEPVKGNVYVKKLQKANPAFYSFYMINPAGLQIAKSDDVFNQVGERAYFKKGMAGESSYMVAIAKTSKKLAFLPAAPILDDAGAPKGVFGGSANMDAINDKVTGRKIGKTGFSYLVNKDNEILAHPDKNLIGQSADSGVKALAEEYASEEVDVKVGAGSFGEKKIKRMVVGFGDGFKVVSQIDMSEIEAPLAEAQNKTYQLLGFSALLSLIFSFALGTAIAKSLNKLSFLADKLSLAQSGDEIDRIAVEVEGMKGSKEVRYLSKALGRLAESIKLALTSLG